MNFSRSIQISASSSFDHIASKYWAGGYLNDGASTGIPARLAYRLEYPVKPPPLFSWSFADSQLLSPTVPAFATCRRRLYSKITPRDGAAHPDNFHQENCSAETSFEHFAYQNSAVAWQKFEATSTGWLKCIQERKRVFSTDAIILVIIFQWSTMFPCISQTCVSYR